MKAGGSGMKKKRGRYAEQEVKLHIKARGKKRPTMKLTIFLPAEVVKKFLPQMERFLKASKKH
jgi:hypothetical protein